MKKPNSTTNLGNSIEFISRVFPTQPLMIQKLVDMASTQIKQAFGEKSKVVIIGPTNVGKSTLYNQLIRDKNVKAEVSPIPGTTRIIQEGDAGLFSLIDTPGTDAVGEQGDNERKNAFLAAADADFLIIIYDAIQGIKKTELELYQSLIILGKPIIVVLNKIDLVHKEEKKVLYHAALTLGLNPEQIIPVSAKSGSNLDQVLLAIAATEPEMVAALGKAIPQFRWKLAWRSIVSAASISAVIALTPLPIIDFPALIVTQSVMVLGIARIYNYEITLQRAREIVAAFGLGLLGRTIFGEISKLGGIPGWFLSTAIAASTTVVMGYAAVVWFEKGEKLSAETISKITQNLTKFILDKLKNIGRKKQKPDKKTLEVQISEVLANSGFAENPNLIESDLISETGSAVTTKPVL